MFELLVLGGGGTAHAVDHFFAEFHGGCEGFGVSAEDESEVSMEEVSIGGEEEVVEMAVADAEEVGYYAVASAGFDEDVECFLPYA